MLDELSWKIQCSSQYTVKEYPVCLCLVPSFLKSICCAQYFQHKESKSSSGLPPIAMMGGMQRNATNIISPSSSAPLAAPGCELFIKTCTSQVLCLLSMSGCTNMYQQGDRICRYGPLLPMQSTIATAATAAACICVLHWLANYAAVTRRTSAITACVLV